MAHHKVHASEAVNVLHRGISNSHRLTRHTEVDGKLVKLVRDTLLEFSVPASYRASNFEIGSTNFLTGIVIDGRQVIIEPRKRITEQDISLHRHFMELHRKAFYVVIVRGPDGHWPMRNIHNSQNGVFEEMVVDHETDSELKKLSARKEGSLDEIWVINLSEGIRKARRAMRVNLQELLTKADEVIAD